MKEQDKRLSAFFSRIKNKQNVRVLTLGGSITTGYCSNPIKESSWAALTFKWLKGVAEKYGSSISFFNMGVSGTDSAFGVIRLKEHVLDLPPDLVIIEYAMNDQWLDEKVRRRSYEHIVRKILESGSALLALFVNERNKPFSSVQDEQQKICEYYDVPYVSWKDCVLQSGNQFEEYFDGDEVIHPNNKGHESIASFLTAKLEKYLEIDFIDTEIKPLPNAENENIFLNHVFYSNENIIPIKNDGWEKESPVHPEWVMHGNAKKGFQTDRENAEIVFVLKGKSIGITYSESNQFADCDAFLEKENGETVSVVHLGCFQKERDGYLGWAYKELVNESYSEKYILRIKSFANGIEKRFTNFTGILVQF